MDELLASRNQLNRASVNFLKVEAETALTFAGIALQSQDSVKRLRNRRLARKAYDKILQLQDRVSLSQDDAQDLAEDLARLRSELSQLGEVL